MRLFTSLKVLISTATLFFVLSIGILIYVSGQNTFYGWRALLVQSGSMEPTIQTGSLIFIRQEEKYQEGDIITFGPRTRPEMFVTHRVVGEVEQDGRRSYKTKGDYNQIEDKEIVLEQDIVGKYRFSIPYLGYLISFAKTQVGVIILVVIPTTLIIYDEVTNLKKNLRRMIEKKSAKKNETSDD